MKSDDYVEKVEGMTAEMSEMRYYTSFDLMKWPKMRLISLGILILHCKRCSEYCGKTV